VFWRDRHEVSDDELNAYVDSALTERRHTQVEAHLDLCDDCSTTVTELRVLRTLMSEMPREPVPRSFVVRQVDLDASPAAAESGLLGSLTPMLGGVASVALVAFLVLTGISTSDSGGSDGGSPLEATPAGQSDEFAGAEGESASGPTDEDTAAPAPAVGLSPTSDNESSQQDSAGDGAEPPAEEEEPERAASGAGVATGTADSGESTAGAEEQSGSAVDDNDEDAVRTGQIVAAIVAVVAGAGAFFFWWRRRQAAI